MEHLPAVDRRPDQVLARHHRVLNDDLVGTESVARQVGILRISIPGVPGCAESG